MESQEMHRAQFLILRTLRHTVSARYSDLRKPTCLDSDIFKFHLRKLVQQKYVHKLESGEYELTPNGKEYANNLSKTIRGTQKQPKLSVAIIARREANDRTEYLLQQRLRNPYFGFWGCLTGPVRWGEAIEAAAQRELKKQTGLTADFKTCAFYRKTDFESESDELLEDKLFAAVWAQNIQGEISHKYTRGRTMWMALDELERQEKYFASTGEFIDMLRAGEVYRACAAYYSHEDY